jgi:hypothetical protein
MKVNARSTAEQSNKLQVEVQETAIGGQIN